VAASTLLCVRDDADWRANCTVEGAHLSQARAVFIGSQLVTRLRREGVGGGVSI